MVWKRFRSAADSTQPFFEDGIPRSSSGCGLRPQAVGRQVGQECSQPDTQFRVHERGPHAVVRAAAEGEVARSGAGGVEAVRSGQAAGSRLARPNATAARTPAVSARVIPSVMAGQHRSVSSTVGARRPRSVAIPGKPVGMREQAQESAGELMCGEEDVAVEEQRGCQPCQLAGFQATAVVDREQVAQRSRRRSC